MTRRLPTKGTIDFFSQYLDALIAHLLQDTPPEKKDEVFSEVRKIQAIKSTFSHLEQLERITKVEPKLLLEKDQTVNMEISAGWHQLALESFVDTFGRYGSDAVSSVAEATFYANAFAIAFGSYNLFFRGEQCYGFELQSRAERFLSVPLAQKAGITKQEIDELRRFQKEVDSDPELENSIRKQGEIPHEDSPLWLPIMQHYDETFGTRLLDISSSVYTGLYFACVGWNGVIDTEHDGILYSFMLGSLGLTMRGFYYDQKPENFDDEMDNIAPESIENSFKDWEHPEVLRLYRSSSASDREIAQDGYFLVKGALKEGYGFGQGFKYRIPAEVKEKIAKELWLAGYTPERMIRGPKGLAAHKKLAKTLGVPIL